jgi:membrane peptidoglycan carboxypeptidase
MATLAAGGVYHKAHFVLKVEKKNSTTGKYEVVGAVKETGTRVFDEAQVDDILATLQKIPSTGSSKFNLDDNRPAAAKTGTWELNADSEQNGDAWTIGATPQLAAASWIGTSGARQALKDKNGGNIGGSGLPGKVWQHFMDEAMSGKAIKQFPAAQNVGDVTVGNGIAPAQQNDQNNGDNNALCTFFGTCNTGNNNGGNNRRNN